jgi:Protein of unknown function (DUF616)
MIKKPKIKIAIITSIFGNNIELFDPPIVFNNASYYAFVDRKHNVKCWNQIDAFDFSCDPQFSARRNSRIYKILPDLFLPDYDYYLWIDSTHAVMKDPEIIINEFLSKSDIALFRHGVRDCLYKEAEAVLKYGYDYPDLVNNQIKFYLMNNYPRNNGLYETPALIRRNTKSILRLNLMWWEHICKFSSRDQISLPYVLNKCNIVPEIIPGRVNDPEAYKTNQPVTNEIFKQMRFSYHKRRDVLFKA